MWVYYPSHKDVHGNELADRLAGTTSIQGMFKLDKQDILKAAVEKLKGDEELERGNNPPLPPILAE